MAQKNLNAILAMAQDAINQLRMEKMSAENYGRDVYRLEYIEEILRLIVAECEKTINYTQNGPHGPQPMLKRADMINSIAGAENIELIDFILLSESYKALPETQKTEVLWAADKRKAQL